MRVQVHYVSLDLSLSDAGWGRELIVKVPGGVLPPGGLGRNISFTNIRLFSSLVEATIGGRAGSDNCCVRVGIRVLPPSVFLPEM